MATPEFKTGLQGFPYNDTVAARPPIQVRTGSFLSANDAAQRETDPAFVHRNMSVSPLVDLNGVVAHGYDRQLVGPEESPVSPISPVLPASRSARGSRTSLNVTDPAPSRMLSSTSVPRIQVDPDPGQTSPPKTDLEKKDVNTAGPQIFEGISLDLPTGSLGDELQTKNMQFSNRGSMFLDGRKVSSSESVTLATFQRPTAATKRIPTSSSVPDRMPPRMMSTDEEALSEKVRHYYAQGTDANETMPQSDIANKMGSRWKNQLSTEQESIITASRAPSTTDVSIKRSPSLAPIKVDNIPREQLELAGGLEDWQDVDNADVDRYGFIVPRSPGSKKDDVPGIKRSPTLQRVSTSLQLASEAPRRKRTVRRSSAENHDRPPPETLTRKSSEYSLTRPSSSKSATSYRRYAFRSASNKLPGNRDRRLLDEAGDMLTLPHSLTAGSLTRTPTGDSDRSSRSKTNPESKATSTAARKKETEREEKWRKMARPATSTSKDPEHKGIGGGMLFSFPPTTDAKLVSRTWKGIPDTWRAPAWHYFLSVSARKNPRSLPDSQLVQLFYEYQDVNSPEDVQIDIDVPRTISSHIMFRRRYRGGQRLLFRVLHAMSLHWPETGYVQGMAALAATLLSYYEEEKSFIMLVRLWECRGLGKLYKEGFGGLMEALNDFENGWLGEGEVAKKLTELNIFPTAYGTRWYLTLFNYSIPFPAQLRVWDVFMLLGDNDAAVQQQPNGTTSSPEDAPFGNTLDVLHATSAALIDGMRDILLDSDFENAMKVLTSWIPIRDEDLFMRVARTEWKMYRERERKRWGK